MAGYSGTPLAKKLGIRDGSSIFVYDAPGNFLALLAPLPDRVTLVNKIAGDTDIVHIFSKEKARLSKALATSLKKIKSDAVIWVSWPKKASKVPTDITEDTIRKIALPLGLVDIKVCAIDDMWSGLKLVIRKERRGSASLRRRSGARDDYE
jgi:hypothetical protein